MIEITAKRKSDILALIGQKDLRLDHVGIAVREISEARKFYEFLGLTVKAEEEVRHEKVRIAMLSLGETCVELLEPLEEDSVIGRFLSRRGEGVHHVAVRIENVDEAFKRLLESGIRLASDAVRTGAGGHRYFFVHPASSAGVLVEVVGARKEGIC
jgi:LAO/AO transport system kinase